MKRTETGFQKFIKPDEEKSLFQWFKVKGINYILVYRLMRDLGLRISDAVRINIDWIQDDSLIFTMLKTKRTIIKYIPTELREWIKNDYIKKNKKSFKNGFMAFNRGNYAKSKGYMHLQKNTIRTEFDRWRRFNRIRDIYYTDKRGRKIHRISPHTLRHHYAEAVYEASGYNILATKDSLGHQQTKTTERYIRGIRNRKQEINLAEAVAKRTSSIS